MTCITGMIAPSGKIIMAGDLQGSSGSYKSDRKDVKVFKKGDFLIGYTSSYRMGQLLRYKLDIPEIPENMDLFEYMCTDFVDAIIKCFDDNNFTRKDSERISGGTFLVGIRGRLFDIESDFQVAESIDPFSAVGSGETPAKASMITYDKVFGGFNQSLATDEQIIDVLVTSIRVASKYITTVGRDVIVVDSDGHIYDRTEAKSI